MTLPKGWEGTQLSDIAEFVMGQAPPGSNCNTTGDGMPFVKAGEFGALRPIIREWTTRPLKVAAAGDILICVVGATAGKLNLGADCAIGRSVAAIRPSAKVPAEFLYARLKSEVLRLRASSTGTAQGVISRETLAAIPLLLPPLAEQRRIVAKLDALTARLARARAELDRVPILTARLRSEAFAVLWEGGRATLQHYLAEPIRNGLSLAGSDQPPGIPALRLSALRGRTANLADVRFLPISEDRAASYNLRIGDVLVSRGNGNLALVGKAALVGDACDPMPIFPDTAFRIRVDPELASPHWLAHVWNSPAVRHQLESVARTTAGIWKIAQRDLLSVSLPLVPVARQRQLAADLDTTFARADRLEAEAARARALLDRLESANLAKALRGELVPQDPDDEPASVLLDRVRAQRAAAPAKPRKRSAKAA